MPHLEPETQANFALYHNSRQAIKKYVKANNKVKYTSEVQFDSMFNRALKGGVEKGDFAQPKGMSLSPMHTSPVATPSHRVPKYGIEKLC
jgi:histone H1/5